MEWKLSRRAVEKLGLGVSFLLFLQSCGLKPTSVVTQPTLTPEQPTSTPTPKNATPKPTDEATSTPTPTQELTPSQQLEMEIENKYGVDISTLPELFAASGQALPKSFKDVPEEWDLGRLKMLDKFLQILPPHFYSASDTGAKFRIILGIYNVPAAFSNGARLNMQLHGIELNFKEFDSARPREAIFHIAHEATHVLTQKSDSEISLRPEFADKTLNLLGDPRFFDKSAEWQQRIVPTLHYGLSNVTKKYELDPEFAARATQKELQQAEFDLYFSYGLSNMSEFLSVLGQNYVLGKDFFIENYSRFLSGDVVIKLYDFVKNDIYKGTEYLTLPNLESMVFNFLGRLNRERKKMRKG